jgi:hypothetical protein
MACPPSFFFASDGAAPASGRRDGVGMAFRDLYKIASDVRQRAVEVEETGMRSGPAVECKIPLSLKRCDQTRRL